MLKRIFKGTGPVIWGILLAMILAGVPLWRTELRLRESRFDLMILKAAAENGCDPCLVKAVTWRESKFDPATLGRDGEIGLMQVKPVVAQEWANARGEKNFDIHQLSDPQTNLRIGSWHLARALQNWSQAADPMPLALAQYNAGRGNVLKWVDPSSLADGEYFTSRIQFPSTQSYVRETLNQYRLYQKRGEF